MNPKNKQANHAQREFLIISLSFFLLCVAWVGFNLYHAYADSTITNDLRMQIIPISSTFDVPVIQALKERTRVTPLSGFTPLESSQSQISQATSQSAGSVPIIQVSPTILVSVTPTPPTIERQGL